MPDCALSRAFSRAETKIAFRYAGVGGKICACSFQHNLAHFQDVTAVRRFQGCAGVLFNKQD
jgi:hypothetical protein